LSKNKRSQNRENPKLLLFHYLQIPHNCDKKEQINLYNYPFRISFRNGTGRRTDQAVAADFKSLAYIPFFKMIKIVVK
jgi:hypothetical protein